MVFLWCPLLSMVTQSATDRALLSMSSMAWLLSRRMAFNTSSSWGSACNLKMSLRASLVSVVEFSAGIWVKTLLSAVDSWDVGAGQGCVVGPAYVGYVGLE